MTTVRSTRTNPPPSEPFEIPPGPYRADFSSLDGWYAQGPGYHQITGNNKSMANAVAAGLNAAWLAGYSTGAVHVINKVLG